MTYNFLSKLIIIFAEVNHYKCTIGVSGCYDNIDKTCTNIDETIMNSAINLYSSKWVNMISKVF